jgi:hypothetical protein
MNMYWLIFNQFSYIIEILNRIGILVNFKAWLTFYTSGVECES